MHAGDAVLTIVRPPLRDLAFGSQTTLEWLPSPLGFVGRVPRKRPSCGLLFSPVGKTLMPAAISFRASSMVDAGCGVRSSVTTRPPRSAGGLPSNRNCTMRTEAGQYA